VAASTGCDEWSPGFAREMENYPLSPEVNGAALESCAMQECVATSGGERSSCGRPRRTRTPPTSNIIICPVVARPEWLEAADLGGTRPRRFDPEEEVWLGAPQSAWLCHARLLATPVEEAA
jgi:hypothetical protein